MKSLQMTDNDLLCYHINGFAKYYMNGGQKV